MYCHVDSSGLVGLVDNYCRYNIGGYNGLYKNDCVLILADVVIFVIEKDCLLVSLVIIIDGVMGTVILLIEMIVVILVDVLRVLGI